MNMWQEWPDAGSVGPEVYPINDSLRKTNSYHQKFHGGYVLEKKKDLLQYSTHILEAKKSRGK